MKKQGSTNSINEKHLNTTCGIAFTLSRIGSRWKINILTLLLKNKKLRYSELKNRLEGISERILTSKLKGLEKDGLINRIVHQQVPPKVEYELTTLGHSLQDILIRMDQWGEANLKNDNF